MLPITRAFRTTRHRATNGWTFIELLVVLVLMSALVAFTAPVVVQQIEKAEVSRIVQDVANIRTGLRTFQLDLRPSLPFELEDMANPVAITDSDILGNPYTAAQVLRWNGPYIDRDIPALTGDTVAFDTGFGGTIENRLVFYNATFNFALPDSAFAEYLALEINGLTGDQFEAVNRAYEGHELPGLDPGESGNGGNFRSDPGIVIDPGLELAPVYFLLHRLK